jgi:hypothetical protein
MKNVDRIYSFFIGVALLFWNPFSFYLLYGRKPVYEITVVHFFYWVVFFGGIASIWLISKKRLGGRFKNFALILTFTGILFSVLVLVNVALGRVKRAKKKLEAVVNADDRGSGLVFVPNSNAKYKTTEFEFDAKINSLGLRNEEVALEKGGKYRILCFGDSWTFGWGVKEEDSWPHKLQDYLRKAGKENVEVINCGRGGQYTTTYKQYLADAVPMLKPDLVIVGVLEEDDLAQLFEMNFQANYGQKDVVKPVVSQDALAAVTEYLTGSFSNIVDLFRNKSADKVAINISEAWKKSANNMLENFDNIHKYRFYTFPDTIREMFLSGNLNPGLVSSYIKFPDRVTIFNNPDNIATQFAITEMKKDMRDMKKICTEYGAKMIFVNLPINFFNGHKVIRSPNDILNPYFENNNKVDSIYASIASATELPYIELTAHFRGLSDKGGYYFRFDGHPNGRGYSEIASYIGQQLLEQDQIK